MTGRPIDFNEGSLRPTGTVLRWQRRFLSRSGSNLEPISGNASGHLSPHIWQTACAIPLRQFANKPCSSPHQAFRPSSPSPMSDFNLRPVMSPSPSPTASSTSPDDHHPSKVPAPVPSLPPAPTDENGRHKWPFAPTPLRGV